jgi:hypothetical protein
MIICPFATPDGGTALNNSKNVSFGIESLKFIKLDLLLVLLLMLLFFL